MYASTQLGRGEITNAPGTVQVLHKHLFDHTHGPLSQGSSMARLEVNWISLPEEHFKYIIQKAGGVGGVWG